MTANQEYLLLCAFVFSFAYTLVSVYISVLYHRGLTHGAVGIPPEVTRFIARTGFWVTGLEPRTWCCMHRLHHRYSDKPGDPHSPVEHGVLLTFVAQIRSYIRILRGLRAGKEEYVSVVADLDLPLDWFNQRRLWFAPYLVHGAIAIGIGYFADAWLLGFFYFAGLMGHPVSGWMVNALAHRFGYRNFPTDDNSRNNRFVAWVLVGEGYQNNHHQNPSSANFGATPREIDLGFWLCHLCDWLGIVEMKPSKTCPSTFDPIQKVPVDF